ncbi:MAG: ABC transporter permease [Actinomycetota bacterium]|nr:ABC transporter permease [Actinomycetota bacterium]
MTTAALAPRPLAARRLLHGLLLGSAAVLLLALVEQVTATPQLTSPGTFGAALRLTIPIMLAGVGAVYSERAGVVNIGLEGMMIMGTWFGAWGAWQFGPWEGVLIGVLGGALGGLIHALATVTFAVDHIVSGVAINILALGGMRFASALAYRPETGGGVTQSPRVGGVGDFNVPFLAGGQVLGWKTPDLLGWLERQHWLFVSDLAGLLRGLTGSLSWLALIAVALVPLTWWLLWRTPWGLRLRSCGENPYAAESLGVGVYRMKYYGVVISGALAGLGGVFLVLEQAGIYREGQTAGRGFIGLAALIFGNWRPTGVLGGAALFGFADALRLRQETAVHALLLFIAVGLALLAAWSLSRRRPNTAFLQALFALGFLAWFVTTRTVPSEFVFMTPYLVTLLVLSLASQRLRMPAADGLQYRRGEAG